jgi:Response regulator containing a CheY-like receiver domain and an HTH DNA-binding domain
MNNLDTTILKKVLVVDDSEVIRNRLLYLLADINGLNVVGQAGNAAEGYALYRSLDPDIIILDIRMPGESGISLLQKIKQDSQATIIAILTNYPYSAYRKRCMELGADYFFDKSTEFEKLKQLFNGNYIEPQTRNN